MRRVSLVILGWLAIGVLDSGWWFSWQRYSFAGSSRREAIVVAIFVGAAGPLAFPEACIASAAGERGWWRDYPERHFREVE